MEQQTKENNNKLIKLSLLTLHNLKPYNKFIGKDLMDCRQQLNQMLQEATKKEQINILKMQLYNLTEEEMLTKLDVKEVKQKLIAKEQELKIVKQKIKNFKKKLENIDTKSLEIWEEELPKRQEKEKLERRIKDEMEVLNKLESHKYNPKCECCMSNPVTKQKLEKEQLIKKLQKEIATIFLTIQDEKNINKLKEELNEITDKLEQKEGKLPLLEATIAKLELEYERKMNLQNKIDKNNEIHQQIKNIYPYDLEKLEKLSQNDIENEIKLLDEYERLLQLNEEIKDKNAAIEEQRQKIIGDMGNN